VLGSHVTSTGKAMHLTMPTKITRVNGTMPFMTACSFSPDFSYAVDTKALLRHN
jgi:hypothetical protein